MYNNNLTYNYIIFVIRRVEYFVSNVEKIEKIIQLPRSNPSPKLAGSDELESARHFLRVDIFSHFFLFLSRAVHFLRQTLQGLVKPAIARTTPPKIFF